MSDWRTISLWMDQLDDPLQPRPALGRELQADVAIIGAGYTGLWTAYYLKRQAPQLRIVILEAETAGFGASGRNGGWLMGNMLGEGRLLADLPAEQRKASYDLLHGIPDEVGAVLQREGEFVVIRSVVEGGPAALGGKVKAGELVNFVAQQVGGKGGGKPDMAMAGGTDASGLPKALDSVQAWVAERL